MGSDTTNVHVQNWCMQVAKTKVYQYRIILVCTRMAWNMTRDLLCSLYDQFTKKKNCQEKSAVLGPRPLYDFGCMKIGPRPLYDFGCTKKKKTARRGVQFLDQDHCMTLAVQKLDQDHCMTLAVQQKKWVASPPIRRKRGQV